jgi:hypothetical protein
MAYMMIEPARHSEEGYDAYEWGTYPRNSVLAGQDRKSFKGSYDTLEQAQEAHPDAEVSQGRVSANNSVDHLPGEEWDDAAQAYRY